MFRLSCEMIPSLCCHLNFKGAFLHNIFKMFLFECKVNKYSQFLSDLQRAKPFNFISWLVSQTMPFVFTYNCLCQILCPFFDGQSQQNVISSHKCFQLRLAFKNRAFAARNLIFKCCSVSQFSTNAVLNQRRANTVFDSTSLVAHVHVLPLNYI